MKALFNKLLPAPLLSIALALLWLSLNRSFEIGHILLGAIFGLLLPLLLRGLRPLPVQVSPPGSVLLLAARVVWDTTVSNFQVIRFLLFPGLRKHPAAFVHVPLDLRDPNGLAVLAMIVCMTPGTAWAEISRDRSMLLMHVLDASDVDAVIADVRRQFEPGLVALFGDPA